MRLDDCVIHPATVKKVLDIGKTKTYYTKFTLPFSLEKNCQMSFHQDERDLMAKGLSDLGYAGVMCQEV